MRWDVFVEDQVAVAGVEVGEFDDGVVRVGVDHLGVRELFGGDGDWD